MLEGEIVSVEAPHPRAAALGIAPRLDGRRVERVEAVGKNLLLRFEGGLVLRSHLRMRGRWQLQAPGIAPPGRPWLVLRSTGAQAVLWHGPLLELGGQGVARLGPDIMASPPDLGGMLGRLRRTEQRREVGEALLDQRLVAGIGNMWKAEALFSARVSPWRRLAELTDTELERILAAASEAMHSGRRRRDVYRRAGLPCRVCGASIASGPQGDGARSAYWCPGCQGGTGEPKA